MSARRLTVWWDGRIAGCLAQDQRGDLSFAYDADWLNRTDARALSHSLPLQPDIFDRRACRPFFGGLLPEADQRSSAAGALGVSAANEFALLDRLGGDVAGALTLLPEGEIPPSPTVFTNPASPLSDAAFAAILDRLPHQPMLAGQAGLRLSLAGAQAKLPVILVDDRPALPR